MMVCFMLIKEMCYRKLNTFFAVIAVALAVGSFLSALFILDIHDFQTSKLLLRKQAESETRMAKLNDEMRKAGLKMGFNLLILPENQNLRDWYADDYASKYMPEDYVMKLADSGIVLVTHFLPSLRRKIEWPETKRTIILIGTRGEVPNMHKNPRKPMVQPVPAGTIVLGHELHRSLGFKVGDRVCLMGRDFTVHKCHSERGSKDDITVWISLYEAQALLDKKGLINSILALECICANQVGLEKLRDEINSILPGTQIIEVGSKVVARAESRLKLKKEGVEYLKNEKESRLKLRAETEHFASIILLIVMFACVAWVAYLGFMNVKDREVELGILRALGYCSGQIMTLFLLKSLVLGLTGGLLGYFTGSPVGVLLGGAIESDVAGILEGVQIYQVDKLMWVVIVAIIISVFAGWLPAMLAVQKDPAEILQKE